MILSGRITIIHDYGAPDQKELRIAEAGGYLNFVPAFLHQPAANTSVAVEGLDVPGPSTEPVSSDDEDLSPDKSQSFGPSGESLKKHGRHGMSILAPISAKLLHVESVGRIAIVELAAILVVISTCFLFGLMIRTTVGQALGS